MEEQIITVHVPKEQYRKFAKLAGQVNVPMQMILSQFVADCVSDRWGLPREPWQETGSVITGGVLLSEQIFWLVGSEQPADEILEAQQKLESCKKEITTLQKELETGYMEAGGVFTIGRL